MHSENYPPLRTPETEWINTEYSKLSKVISSKELYGRDRSWASEDDNPQEAIADRRSSRPIVNRKRVQSDDESAQTGGRSQSTEQISKSLTEAV